MAALNIPVTSSVTELVSQIVTTPTNTIIVQGIYVDMSNSLLKVVVQYGNTDSGEVFSLVQMVLLTISGNYFNTLINHSVSGTLGGAFLTSVQEGITQIHTDSTLHQNLLTSGELLESPTAPERINHLFVF